MSGASVGVPENHAGEVPETTDCVPESLEDCIAQIRQLKAALETRNVIGQAKGILMASQQITAEAAFRRPVPSEPEDEQEASHRGWGDVAPTSPLRLSNPLDRPEETDPKPKWRHRRLLRREAGPGRTR